MAIYGSIASPKLDRSLYGVEAGSITTSMESRFFAIQLNYH